MNDRMNTILSQGRVAVVTGAARGIGAGIVRRLSERGMAVVLVDRDEAALQMLAASLTGRTLIAAGDVTDTAFVTALRDRVAAELGPVALLVNNAGVKDAGGPWDDPAVWQRMLDVNLWAALRMQSLFVPAMIASDQPAAILNLGSKEGITTPPGFAGYSVSKAAIKVLTEQLEHELRNATGGRVSAHLLVPGYTWTAMNGGGDKPDAAWSVDRLLDYAFPRLLHGDFYIICPDGEVTTKMDHKRIRWGSDDIINNRPALSRWHPDHADAFAAWMKWIGDG